MIQQPLANKLHHFVGPACRLLDMVGGSGPGGDGRYGEDFVRMMGKVGFCRQDRVWTGLSLK